MIVCKLFFVFQYKSSHWVLLNFLSQKSPSAVILGVVEPILFLSFYTCSNDETSNTRMERGSGPRIWLFIHHHPFKRFLEVHHLWMRHGVIEIQMFSLFSPDRWFSDAIGIVLICCCSIVAKTLWCPKADSVLFPRPPMARKLRCRRRVWCRSPCLRWIKRLHYCHVSPWKFFDSHSTP